MAQEAKPKAVRGPRIDAQRNRQRLLETAKATFAEKGEAAGLEEIARLAGVGIGTLYRHFPTRDALVEAVYRNETQQLAEAAAELATTHAPVEALRAWMRIFVDHIATKQLMAGVLGSIVGGCSDLYADAGAQIKTAMAMLVDRAVANGDIRLDLDPLDMLRALAGVANVSAGPNWEASAKRLVDILIAGVRTPGGEGR
ncbi:TetR/AcrR family transcriptional regulator [Tardiphaga sp. 866_E4_N2_1]|jgi:AcrR family transcriptional regulator|uniref:TetR/AcrR family transcriptional regulator n=1 Tax=unclassified Tardiphaga TaxID=2631404 RepID=UPI003F245D07